ncbi:MAG: GGDEF domain-containing protein, partial [Bacillota bacterium]|nr:GGDEF domain-containing protein [Bacillota bacterium]
MISLTQIAVIIAFPVLLCISRFWLVASMGQSGKRYMVRILAEGLLVSALLCLAYFIQLSVFLWAVLYYGLCILTHWADIKGWTASHFLSSHLTFICDMTICFVFLGIAARVLETDQVTAMEDPWVRLGYVAVAVSVHTISNVIYGFDRVRDPWVVMVKTSAPEGRTLAKFVLFTVIFLFLESVLLMLPLPVTAFSDYYLVASNLLVLTVVMISVFYTLQIFHKSADEREYFLLKKERENVMRRMEALEQTVYEDRLTGLHSRHSAFETMESLKESRRSFSIVFMDLDRLKQINDEWGHTAGDQHLIRFARRVQQLLREGDIFARVGGDEFLLIMPDCSLENACRRMERVRET